MPKKHSPDGSGGQRRQSRPRFRLGRRRNSEGTFSLGHDSRQQFVSLPSVNNDGEMVVVDRVEQQPQDSRSVESMDDSSVVDLVEVDEGEGEAEEDTQHQRCDSQPVLSEITHQHRRMFRDLAATTVEPALTNNQRNGWLIYESARATSPLMVGTVQRGRRRRVRSEGNRPCTCSASTSATTPSARDVTDEAVPDQELPSPDVADQQSTSVDAPERSDETIEQSSFSPEQFVDATTTGSGQSSVPSAPEEQPSEASHRSGSKIKVTWREDNVDRSPSSPSSSDCDAASSTSSLEPWPRYRPLSPIPPTPKSILRRVLSRSYERRSSPDEISSSCDSHESSPVPSASGSTSPLSSSFTRRSPRSSRATASASSSRRILPRSLLEHSDSSATEGSTISAIDKMRIRESSDRETPPNVGGAVEVEPEVVPEVVPEVETEVETGTDVPVSSTDRPFPVSSSLLSRRSADLPSISGILPNTTEGDFAVSTTVLTTTTTSTVAGPQLSAGPTTTTSATTSIGATESGITLPTTPSTVNRQSSFWAKIKKKLSPRKSNRSSGRPSSTGTNNALSSFAAAALSTMAAGISPLQGLSTILDLTTSTTPSTSTPRSAPWEVAHAKSTPYQRLGTPGGTQPAADNSPSFLSIAPNPGSWPSTAEPSPAPGESARQSPYKYLTTSDVTSPTEAAATTTTTTTSPPASSSPPAFVPITAPYSIPQHAAIGALMPLLFAGPSSMRRSGSHQQTTTGTTTATATITSTAIATAATPTSSSSRIVVDDLDTGARSHPTPTSLLSAGVASNTSASITTTTTAPSIGISVTRSKTSNSKPSRWSALVQRLSPRTRRSAKSTSSKSPPSTAISPVSPPSSIASPSGTTHSGNRPSAGLALATLTGELTLNLVGPSNLRDATITTTTTTTTTTTAPARATSTLSLLLRSSSSSSSSSSRFNFSGSRQPRRHRMMCTMARTFSRIQRTSRFFSNNSRRTAPASMPISIPTCPPLPPPLRRPSRHFSAAEMNAYVRDWQNYYEAERRYYQAISNQAHEGIHNRQLMERRYDHSLSASPSNDVEDKNQNGADKVYGEYEMDEDNFTEGDEDNYSTIEDDKSTEDDKTEDSKTEDDKTDNDESSPVSAKARQKARRLAGVRRRLADIRLKSRSLSLRSSGSRSSPSQSSWSDTMARSWNSLCPSCLDLTSKRKPLRRCKSNIDLSVSMPPMMIQLFESTPVDDDPDPILPEQDMSRLAVPDEESPLRRPARRTSNTPTTTTTTTNGSNNRRGLLVELPLHCRLQGNRNMLPNDSDHRLTAATNDLRPHQSSSLLAERLGFEISARDEADAGPSRRRTPTPCPSTAPPPSPPPPPREDQLQSLIDSESEGLEYALQRIYDMSAGEDDDSSSEGDRSTQSPTRSTISCSRRQSEIEVDLNEEDTHGISLDHAQTLASSETLLRFPNEVRRGQPQGNGEEAHETTEETEERHEKEAKEEDEMETEAAAVTATPPIDESNQNINQNLNQNPDGQGVTPITITTTTSSSSNTTHISRPSKRRRSPSPYRETNL